MQAKAFSQISELLSSTPLQMPAPEQPVDYLVTDSRRISNPSRSIFFAIDGESRSADGFIMDAWRKGIRSFIVKQNISPQILSGLPDSNIILVPDVLASLQKIAADHRAHFHYPVIGITGSNGKTIVKEWLFQLLGEQFHIVRSPKSYNSQIGVPLSVWRMNEGYDLAIFEAGISKKAEMLRLEKIIKPDLGVLTFMGEAHAEGFTGFREKLREKLDLFRHARALVYCEDDERVRTEVQLFKQNERPDLQLLGWSRQHETFVSIHEIKETDEGSFIIGHTKKGKIDLFLPFTDAASVYNAITAFTVCLYFDISLVKLAAFSGRLQRVEMRLELLAGINNCSVINDSYSADLNSLEIALDFLDHQHQHQNKTVILSDLLQSGLSSEDLYKKIAALINTGKIHRFIGIGSAISSFKRLFAGISELHFYDHTNAFLHAIPTLGFRNETILLKGARVFEFEKVSRALQQRIHETVLEINLNAIRENIKIYKSFLSPGVKIMAMVKAFSYGSGSFEIANLLQHEGIDYLAVAYADEGVELRKAGIRLPIMIMNTEHGSFENVLDYNLEPEIYSFSILEAFHNFLLSKNISSYPVHIKIDTGMHRQGFLEDDAERLTTWFEHNKTMKIVSVFSHLAASDDPKHDRFTQIQLERLNSFSTLLENNLGYHFIKHIGNSSAIHRHKDMQLNMVRLGIGMYGVDPLLNLRNVTTLKTTVSQVKKVAKGESVGYGRNAMLNRDSEIAVVRIGYADGYPRVLGNGKAFMDIGGMRYPVIGNVCMDMLMLDVTGGNVQEEDEVIVFGEPLPVWELAEWAGTISYEILTNISQRVKRVYYEE
jgi:alanine racemase